MQSHRTESYLLWSLGDLQRDRGGFEEAVGSYNLSLELIGANEPSLRCNVLTSLSVLRRWQGNYYDAALLANEALILATAHNLVFEELNARSRRCGQHARTWAKSSRASKELDEVLLRPAMPQRQDRSCHRPDGLRASRPAPLRQDRRAEHYIHEALKLIHDWRKYARQHRRNHAHAAAGSLCRA